MPDVDEAVLLVDDEPNVLSGYRRQLGRRYTLLTAEGGDEALELLARRPDIAVVIADMRMPRMNGVQLLAEIEQRRPDAVRMMLTGNVDQETAVQAVNCGHVFRFINKPAPAEVVIEAIESALTRYRLGRAERELVRQAEVTQRALERERIAAGQQRDFIGMVSHEFRTPLAIIDSAVEILGGPYQITEQQKSKRIKMIKDSVLRMTDLMESILDVSRLDGGTVKFHPEPVDLSALLQMIAGRLEAAQSTHKVQVKLPASPIAMIGDPKLLDHVFANLIGNAIKYSPGKNRVIVVADTDDRDVKISVADEGVGVPADEAKKIFDRFYRASTSSGIPGTGIGLFIVDQFVRLHGGRVEMQSAVGAGSVFTALLPRQGPGDPPISARSAG
jgi:signal transduction histidine kinase